MAYLFARYIKPYMKALSSKGLGELFVPNNNLWALQSMKNLGVCFTDSGRTPWAGDRYLHRTTHTE